jgi:hypothetical protein
MVTDLLTTASASGDTAGCGANRDTEKSLFSQTAGDLRSRGGEALERSRGSVAEA